MATDVAPAASPTPHPTLPVPRAVHRRRGWILLAAMVFQLWLWGTRINNLVQDADGFSAAFVAVHAVLYVASIGVALVLGAIGWRMVREARAAAPAEHPA